MITETKTNKQHVDLLEDDLERIYFEDQLQQAIAAGDAGRIQHWMDECQKFSSNPSTSSLVEKGRTTLELVTGQI